MKRAIVVVSFGTTYHDTCKKNIYACEEQIQEAFEGYDFYRAYTSTMVIKKLKERDGIFVDTPKEILDKLYREGYEEVVVQSLHIICGIEYDKLVAQVSEFKDKFQKIVVGRPLLTTIEDYKKAVEALKSQIPVLEKDEAVVLMGHGTYHSMHAAYPAIDYMLKQQELPIYMGTVEGYPEIGEVVTLLKKDKVKKVILMPFMLVAGDHATEDMAGEEDDSWKNVLLKEGFEVKTYIQGLGENEEIRKLFVEHALACK